MLWLEWCFDEDDELVAPAAPEADDDEAAALLSVSQDEEEFALALFEELLEATALLALS